METTLRRCRRCLLPATVPRLSFDDSDLCDICQTTPSVAELARQREELCEALGGAIDPHRAAVPYACVVAFSGGKDSSYTLKLLVEQYQLRCLAVTIDNGFLAKGTADNCRAVCGSLGVDHVMFTPNPQFVRTMFGISAVQEGMHSPAAIQRASSLCNSCISLINTHILQKAVEVGAPLVAGGYLSGQLPRDAATLTLRPSQSDRPRAAMIHRYVRAFGEAARPYFTLGRTADHQTREITVINPMLGFALPEEEILQAISALGWKRPRDTGLTSTNCRLNDLGVYIHQRRHGFHAYAFEIADQLRHGLMTRDEAERKLLTLPEVTDIQWLADRIGVSTDGL